MIIFDGYQAAQALEQSLPPRVAQLAAKGIQLRIAAILFAEDAGSVLYTRLKKEAAERIGIGYEIYTFSMTDAVDKVLDQIRTLNQNPAVTGIIIQKPGKSRWLEIVAAPHTAQDFQNWWSTLVTTLDIHKDVDGLHPQTLTAIQNNTWQSEGKVLPATAKAVISILTQADLLQPDKKVIILGKSDILGKPLFYYLQNQNINVEMIGSKELTERIEQNQALFDADIVISATGRPGLITGELIKHGAALIDVGEPKGDIDQISVAAKASFLTPVPGGVGPMTVVSLLENAVELAV